jgi:hypothetical protein
VKTVEIIDARYGEWNYYQLSLAKNDFQVLTHRQEKVPPPTGTFGFGGRFKSFFRDRVFRFPALLLYPENRLINLTVEPHPARKNWSFRQRTAAGLKTKFGLTVEDFEWISYPLEEETGTYAVSLLPKREIQFLKRALKSYEFRNGLFCLPSLWGHLEFFKAWVAGRENSDVGIIMDPSLTRYMRKDFDPIKGIKYRFFDLRKIFSENPVAARPIHLPQVVSMPDNVKNVFIWTDPTEPLKSLKWPKHFQFVTDTGKEGEISLLHRILFKGISLGLATKEANEWGIELKKPRPPRKLTSHKGKMGTLLILGIFVTYTALGWTYFHTKKTEDFTASLISGLANLERDEKRKMETQREAAIFPYLNELRRWYPKTFFAFCSIFSDFDQPIWLDTLTLSTEGVGIPPIKGKIWLKGKTFHGSPKASELKMCFERCLHTSGVRRKEGTNVMDLEIKLKTPRSEGTEFVCSLLSEPEDYL